MDRHRIKDYVSETLKKQARGVDYIDIRVGGSRRTALSIRKRQIEEVSKPRSFGGSVRVLHRGGWGFVAFSEIEALPEAVGKAINWAKRVGREKSQLAPVEPQRDAVKLAEKDKGFEEVNLAKKIEIVRAYDTLAWDTGKKLVNVVSTYSDAVKWTLFASTEGALVEQEKAYVSAGVGVTAKEADVIQRYHLSLCDNNWGEIFGKEKEVRETVLIAEEMAASEVVKAGSYTVIIDQKMAGVFVHEAFGHLSEGDNTYENPQLVRVMKLGRRFGSDKVTIVDYPTRIGWRGSYKYDDEGVPASRAVLLDKGVLVGRMHSRETAGKMGEVPNGHARAAGVGQVPLVRMGITCIEPGKATFEEMLSSVNRGLYCINWQAGQTDHERFTFTAGYAREINRGKLGRMVRDVKLTGNLFKTLANVEMVGNDAKYMGGTCGKGGQYVPETSVAPHVLIKDLQVIGGEND